MIKTIACLTAILTTAGLAQAQPLPAPPTAKYTPEAQPSCDSQKLQVYFADGEAILTTASHHLLVAAQSELEGCIVGPVSLTANAADAASPSAAESLAQARLDVVTQALEEMALPTPRIDAQYELASAPSALINPKARAVEIEMTAWAPHVG